MATTSALEQPKTVGLDDALPADALRLETRRFNRNSLVAYCFMGLLIATTIIVSGLVVYLADVDRGMIMSNKITAKDRLITENVLMTLIGATFIQVGAGAILIVKSMFPSESSTQA